MRTPDLRPPADVGHKHSGAYDVLQPRTRLLKRELDAAQRLARLPDRGDIDTDRLRRLLAVSRPAGRPLVFAVDASTWARCDVPLPQAQVAAAVDEAGYELTGARPGTEAERAG